MNAVPGAEDVCARNAVEAEEQGFGMFCFVLAKRLLRSWQVSEIPG